MTHAASVVIAGIFIFATYAIVQATQLSDATPAFAVYDSDNYPQVCTQVLITLLVLNACAAYAVGGTLQALQL